MLFVGDSVAHNADFASLEIATKTRIRSVKAYSSVNDNRARWPKKNITDVTTNALMNTREDDEFSHLIIAAPTVDISNIDTSKITEDDTAEVFKEKITASCQNVYATATSALSNNPHLKKVVILQHAPRYDTVDVDPLGLKTKLAMFANSILGQLWHSSALKEKIIVGKHRLDCTDDKFEERYTDERTGWYDGVHMYGRCGLKAYTDSLIEIFKTAIPHVPFIGTDNHSSYRNNQKKTTNQKKMTNQRHHFKQNVYTVPVNNKFDILGN